MAEKTYMSGPTSDNRLTMDSSVAAEVSAPDPLTSRKNPVIAAIAMVGIVSHLAHHKAYRFASNANRGRRRGLRRQVD